MAWSSLCRGNEDRRSRYFCFQAGRASTTETSPTVGKRISRKPWAANSCRCSAVARAAVRSCSTLFLDLPFGLAQTLVQAQTALHLEGKVGRLNRPSPAGRLDRPALLTGMVRGTLSRILAGPAPFRRFLRASGTAPA